MPDLTTAHMPKRCQMATETIMNPGLLDFVDIMVSQDPGPGRFRDGAGPADVDVGLV